MLLKKDDFDLAHRRLGSTYTELRRSRIIQAVNELKTTGISKRETLQLFGVGRPLITVALSPWSPKSRTFPSNN
tara:strand:- start:60 stop:281 length:222 start_codon:yes stop_codon:yes gene_type:complete